mmetsp:Transcript_29273/g.52348  ORF Transcript_29273/g.52348 Transcript_29273/m.52348 type:complete len:468 (-) Transcript_29273:3548-4951(-)
MIQRRQFGLLRKLFGIREGNATAHVFGTYAPTRAIPEHQAIYQEPRTAKLETTTLPNGVRIISESAAFPNVVRLGVVVNAGPRDETSYNSGVSHALYRTYLKTNFRTNEQLNYCIAQMAGGHLEAELGHETLLYSGQCLSHDVYDMLQVLSDVALDEKTVADEEAAQWRIDEFWKLNEVNSTPLSKAEHVRNTVAYGLKGLGMPIYGFQSNFQNIGCSHLNAFRKTHATPDRMVVYGAGILNHSEFVNAVSPYFVHLKADKGPAREKSQYLGGEFRELSESPETTISLHFEGAKAAQQIPQLVAQTILGSTGDRALSRAQTHFHANQPWVQHVHADSSAYSDSGLFGLVLQVPSNKGAETADLITQQLTSLANVEAAEVERAKRTLALNLLESHEDTTYRLRHIMKNAALTGKAYTVEEAVASVQQVTADQVKQFVAKALKTPPTLVVVGGDNHSVPSADKFASRLK